MPLTHYFRSDDTGAPSMDGSVANSLVTILDALLVNGYNSLSGVTIARTGATATATYTAHGYREGAIIRIAGADQADYNGDFRISNVTANTFDFTVANSPTTPATGTITAKVAPLDWTIAFTSGDERSYQQPAGSNGFYLNVSNGAASNYSRTRLFETVTAAGVASGNGTNPIPTDAIVSGGFHFHHHTGAAAGSRSWVAVGCKETGTIYLFNTGSSSTHLSFLFVTDLVGGPGGGYDTIHGGNYSSTYAVVWFAFYGIPTSTAAPSTYTMMVRGLVTGSALRVSPNGLGLQSSTTSSSPGTTNQIDYATHGLYCTETHIWDPGQAYAGKMPGMLSPCHNRPFSAGDTFTGGVGTPWVGREYLVVSCTSAFQLFIEISDDWEV